VEDTSIRVPKAAELIAARIRRAIAVGELPPGDNVPSEAQMALDFGVSRPTVREAVRILESEGLVSIRRGSKRGGRVRLPDSGIVARAAGLALQTRGATLGDIFQVRMIIEPPAARLAAERRPTEAAAVLRTHLQREFDLTSDRVAVTQAIATFHQLLMENCGSVSVGIIALALTGVFERHVHAGRAPRPPMPESRVKELLAGLRSHGKLIDLIETGDGAGAEAHWRAHMQAAARIWFSHIASDTRVEVLD